ncbi:type IV secretion protein Rhs [Nonomuraea sp. K274]|uniref:Type IV secretion protein Rhs n=1 Tax=Nonomuraea cypriaca TaxID=1187855 RepID=A0A931AB90_9ACTN|nr:RHS repeat-associated core domain-containing protein [Nonomuraea cypriaca]MBF8186167.1 type IV secretion protein Rhs [Nonomuraea cypriaca]
MVRMEVFGESPETERSTLLIWYPDRLRWFARACAMMAVLVAVPLAPALPAQAERRARPGVQEEEPVPGLPVPVLPKRADAAAAKALKAAPPVTWPRTGTVELRPGGSGRIADGSLAVRMDAASSRATPPERVKVEVLDRAAAPGVVLRVSPGQGVTRAGRARLRMDYSGFRHAFGGDYATRLGLVKLPACALEGTARDCPAPERVPAENDVEGATLTADVDVAGAQLYALTSAASGPSGNYGATSLAPSATWSVGPQSGDFSWNYPMRVPPAIAGDAPEVTLGYSAQSVDGRTSATNNQASWAGEGFDLNPGGYIERRYKSCSADGKKTGDMCWDHDNATLVLGGSAVELVKDATTKAWRPRRDDGTRIEQLTGAANGDDDGEHWRVTTTDGTQYVFGLNRLPGWTSGKPETRSAWTVPVFGNEAGEPCHDSTAANAWCRQAWRWNLDYSADRHGNAITYWYETEQNHYGRDDRPELGTPYVRGGHLARIDYGYRSGELFTRSPAARVVFTVAERCVPGGAVTCAADQLKKETAASWPDVPFDRNCAAGESCTDRTSPTFWTRKRLAKVTTRVLSGSAYQDVDSWTLAHSFPATGDGLGPALWLTGIEHAGHVGGTVTLPEVTFAGVQLDNRVDADEGRAPLIKWRVQSVYSEAGAELRVTYAPEQCTPSNLPAPDRNTMRCFPQRWVPQDEMEVVDWFHKHVVAQTAEIDRTARSPWLVTDYEYAGGAAWRYAENILTKPEERTWSDWRGFGRVRVRQGDGQDTRRTLTEHVYFRGMDGDRLAAGGQKSAQVEDSEGGTRADHDQFAGFERETVIHDGDGGKILSATLQEPWSRQTATSTFEGVTKAAHAVQAKATTVRTLKADGAWRRTSEERAYDEHGIVTQVDDRGDVADPADDKCTRYTYARDTGTWMLDFVSRAETVAKPCSATPERPADVLADERTSFDGRAFGQPPVRGDVTRTEELAGYDGTTPRHVTEMIRAYDGYGRVTSETDASGGTETTTYVPASGYATEVRSANPLGHADVTHIDPAWGEPVAQVDENGRRTDFQHDPLGRLVKVWQHDRDRSAGQSPNTEYAYIVRPDGPNVVTTRTLAAGGAYITSHELYDGLMRERQTQEPAPGGGRVLTDTFHNSLGEIAKTNTGYYSTGEPGTDLLGVSDDDVAGQITGGYDGTGELIRQSFLVKGVEKWTTEAVRLGDRVHITPPPGGTATTHIADAEDRVIELRQYKGATPTGAYESTTYTYDKAGRPATVTDPAGNVWRHHYDLRGREAKVEDPDKGTTTMVYNDTDEVVSTTDARGRTLVHAYDALGRKVATHEGSAAGPKLAEWRYDTLAKGHLAASIRYVDGQAYTAEINAVDREYRTLRQTVTIPAREGGLAGSYTFNTRYTPDDQVQSITFPEAGGLAAETVTYDYDGLRQPVQVTGLSSYVTDARYSKLGETLQYELSTGTRKTWLTFTHEEGTRRLVRSQVDRDNGNGSDLDLHYDYDGAGNVTKIADRAGGRDTDTQCLTYDHLRRLTAAWTATDGCAARSPRSELIGGAAPYATSYTYDVTGNRTKEVQHAFGAHPEVTRTYAYPEAGAARPHALSSVSPAGAATAQPSSYVYDAAGNTVTRRTGQSEQQLAWDAEGNLESVTEGGKTTSFIYDADGDRLLRKGPDEATLYVDDMELRLDHAEDAVEGSRYYTVNGQAVAMRDSAGKVFFFGSDHHGTANAAVDAASGELAVRRQTPFGTDRGAAPPWWPGQRGFVGGTVDAGTGLVHLGAREYDPETGRFLSVDPVIDESDPQQLHGYAYANNSPVSMSDPDGQLWWFAVAAAVRIGIQLAARAAARAAARRAAELARKRAIEIARRKAMEVARRKAAQAAQRRAAEKARRAAEAAARRRAAATARARAATARRRAASESRARRSLAQLRGEQRRRVGKEHFNKITGNPSHRSTTRNAQQRQSPPKTQRTPATPQQSSSVQRYDWSKIHKQIDPYGSGERRAFTGQPETPEILYGEKSFNFEEGLPWKVSGRGAGALKLGEAVVRVLHWYSKLNI